MTRSCCKELMETNSSTCLQPFADHLFYLYFIIFFYLIIHLFIFFFYFFCVFFFFFFNIHFFPFSYFFSYLGSDIKKYEPHREKTGFLPMQSVTHVVKYVIYCLEIGLCCLLFLGLIYFEACSKNSLGVSR